MKKQIGILENQLVVLFEKAPHLPANIRDILVTIAPWCALIFGILGLVVLLGAGVAWLILTLATLWLAIWVFIPVIIGLISAVLSLWAFPGLNAGLKSGWDKLFLSQIISVIGMILSLLGTNWSAGSIVWSIIGFYLLFEIRSHYK